MAVQFDTPITRGVTEWKALPEELDIDPELNGRHDLPDITPMVESILKHGQLQPVTIRKCDGKPKLVAGFTRYRAIAHINTNHLYEGPNPLTLRCSYTQLTDRQAFLANIEENRMRNATTPVDDAHNIQRLINVWQMTEAQVADVYRASTSWVKGRLQLLDLSPAAEEAVRTKRVVGPAVKAIAKLSRENQKKVLAKPGPVTMADVKAASPAPAKKPELTPGPRALSAALRVLLAECDQQPDVMVFEIHRDTIRAVRDAMEGK